MRAFLHPSGSMRVAYNSGDTSDFSAKWSCSTVEGSGSFSYAANGDLIDTSGTAAKGDGEDWLAFSQDCQTYGNERRKALAPKTETHWHLEVLYDKKNGWEHEVTETSRKAIKITRKLYQENCRYPFRIKTKRVRKEVTE